MLGMSNIIKEYVGDDHDIKTKTSMLKGAFFIKCRFVLNYHMVAFLFSALLAN